MEKRQLGQSEVRVSAIAFGAWAVGGWMWGGTDVKKSVAAIRAGIDSGMTTIDTAPAYGLGLSERIVGEVIKDVPRHSVQILTKFGLRWDEGAEAVSFEGAAADSTPIDLHRSAGRESVIQECEASLRRLGVETIDLFQLHWPDRSTPIEETMLALAELVEAGKIRAAGVSNFSVAQMEEAESVFSFVSNQMPYSMVNRGIEADVLPHCITHDKAVLAYSPLQRGLLTGKFTAAHAFQAGDHRGESEYFTAENIRAVDAFLDAIRPIAEAHGATLSQLVIAWTIAQPGITSALVGARDADQALANAKAGEIRLTPDDLATISSELASLRLEGI